MRIRGLYGWLGMAALVCGGLACGGDETNTVTTTSTSSTRGSGGGGGSTGGTVSTGGIGGIGGTGGAGGQGGSSAGGQGGSGGGGSGPMPTGAVDTWQWSQPLPQGNRLRAVEMLTTGTWLVVGHWGTVMRTTDTGVSWSLSASGTTEDLAALDCNGALIGWAVGHTGTIVKTTDGGVTWSSQVSGTAENLNGVSFASTTHGWAVGDNGTILATTNGGSSWASQTSTTMNDLEDVAFADLSNGWAVGRLGTIIATSNGGGTWAPQTSGVSTELSSVSFVTTSQGWAVGDDAAILTTANGGGTWTAQNPGINPSLYPSSAREVHFVDTMVGYVALSGDGEAIATAVITTADGGANWTLHPIELSTNWHAITASATRMVVVGSGGAVGSSTDTGATVTMHTNGIRKPLSDVALVDASTAYAVGYSFPFFNVMSTVIKTTDGGSSWTTLTVPTDKILNGVSFVDGTTGFAAGDDGTIIATVDGTHWTDQSVGGGDIEAVFARSATRAWAVGQGGDIYRTTNGTTWNTMGSGTTKHLYSVAFVDDNTGYCVGVDGTILKTTTGGTTWSPQTANPNEWFFGVSFSTANNGWAVGTATYHTSNGGLTWSPSGAWTGHDVVAISPNLAWAVGPSGEIRHTADGQTWTLQVSGTSHRLGGIDITADGEAGLAVGAEGTVLVGHDAQ